MPCRTAAPTKPQAPPPSTQHQQQQLPPLQALSGRQRSNNSQTGSCQDTALPVLAPLQEEPLSTSAAHVMPLGDLSCMPDGLLPAVQAQQEGCRHPSRHLFLMNPPCHPGLSRSRTAHQLTLKNGQTSLLPYTHPVRHWQVVLQERCL